MTIDRDDERRTEVGSHRSGRRRVGRAVLVSLLIAATIGAFSVAAANGSYAGAITITPFQTDDDGDEPADPPDDVGDGTDQPADPADEPAPEPGSVPVFVWIGAGLLVAVALLWGVSRAGDDDSGADDSG